MRVYHSSPSKLLRPISEAISVYRTLKSTTPPPNEVSSTVFRMRLFHLIAKLNPLTPQCGFHPRPCSVHHPQDTERSTDRKACGWARPNAMGWQSIRADRNRTSAERAGSFRAFIDDFNSCRFQRIYFLADHLPRQGRGRIHPGFNTKG